MYHYTYMTASSTGHYYVGRHSTNKIKDNYLGSGKWVKVCKKKGVELHKKILEFYESFEDLIAGEKKLISDCISDDKNMNLTTESVGFSVGDLNPAKSQKERERRSKHNWMKTSEGKEWFSKNNPSKREDVKKLRSERLKKQWNDPQYRSLKIENHFSKTKEFREFFSVHNPMKKEENRVAASERAFKQLSSGTHNSQIKVSCTKCKEIFSVIGFFRWHKLCK